MSELPDDLLEEILCRLPATSLKRLQYTCKRWNHIFNDRRFTRKHFRKAPKESLFLLFKKLEFYSMSFSLYRSPTAEITGELNLIVPNRCLDQFRISQFCHSSDGLLLCVCVDNKEQTMLVLWNPCTGQTKWIQPNNPCKKCYIYALGSYQGYKSGNNSYKILSHGFNKYGVKYTESEIYEINSDSWRILDVTMDCNLMYFWNVSLKGKTYWIAKDRSKRELGMFLISFDYTTERFERLCLPYQYPFYRNMSLSVVREKKLSVLLQSWISPKTEIWVTNKIVDETKVVSWIKISAMDLDPQLVIWKGLNFLGRLSEESPRVYSMFH